MTRHRRYGGTLFTFDGRDVRFYGLVILAPGGAAQSG